MNNKLLLRSKEIVNDSFINELQEMIDDEFSNIKVISISYEVNIIVIDYIINDAAFYSDEDFISIFRDANCHVLNIADVTAAMNEFHSSKLYTIINQLSLEFEKKLDDLQFQHLSHGDINFIRNNVLQRLQK